MTRIVGLLLLVLQLAPRALAAEFRWGGDAEGGAPFCEADPNDPAKLRGFDVEVAAEMAKGLGRTPHFVQVQWSSIDQSVARGDFDIGMSGLEGTASRLAPLGCTIPVFGFPYFLTVREKDRDRFRSLDDLRGRKVATLGATVAYDILLREQQAGRLEVVSYDDDVHPYEDLAGGRVDAVMLDNIIAARSLRHVSGLIIQPDAVTAGHYVGVLARGNTKLRDKINDVLRARMKDGTLERIYRQWNIWDEHQPAFFAGLAGGGQMAESGVGSALAAAPVPPPAAGRNLLAVTLNYVPALLKASVITIVLSCFSMALAIFIGVFIASGRVYGNVLVRSLLTTYVEVVRGTPVLLQLFVLYYGLSEVILLPASIAALLGLGLNYAAYESEIYRGALEAVPRGQLEAARTLGLSEVQVLRLVRGPQAFRLALAPMTNDFVALLKDSSLVSVITVVELTKQTSIFAANIGSWVVPGILCAGLYLILSLPLSRLATRLEERWRAASE